jgi:hypothetical protein
MSDQYSETDDLGMAILADASTSDVTVSISSPSNTGVARLTVKLIKA